MRGPAPVAAASLAALDDPTLRSWLTGALGKPPGAFAPSEPAWDRLTRYLVESSGACSMFLLPEVDPHRGAPGGRFTAHAAATPDDLDLLRCQYRAGELELVLTEGANFLVLEVVRGAPFEEPGAVRALLLRTVRLMHEGRAWDLKITRKVDLTRGTHRLGNEGAPPVADVQNRDQRFDVVAVDGRLFFVFYKKIEQRVGWEPDAEWFDAETRALLR
jgi:hypothetical protein